MMSTVMCHFVFFFFLVKVVELVDGGSVINGSSPPRLGRIRQWYGNLPVDCKTILNYTLI